MLHVILRWSIPLVSLLLVGPIAGWLTSSLRAPDGGPDATLLVCTSPLAGIVAGVASLLLAGAVGAVGARLLNQRTGLFSAGLVLAWAAWGTGRVDRILARTQSGATLYTIAVEGAVLGLLAVAVAFIILRVPARRPVAPVGAAAPGSGAAVPTAVAPADYPEPREFDVKQALPGITAAIAAGAAAAWVIAQEPLKGQTVAAATIAGIAAAAAGRLLAQHLTAVVFFAGLGVLAAAGPALATIVHSGTLGPTKAALGGTLFALARPLPMDWIAGAFLGVPLGLSWVGSMIDHHPAATHVK